MALNEVDESIVSVIEMLTEHLHNERNRLTIGAEVSGYLENMQFQEMLLKLVSTPIGQVKSLTELVSKESSIKTNGWLPESRHNPSPKMKKSLQRSSQVKLIRHVATFPGKDRKVFSMTKPSSVVALPQLNRFGVLHDFNKFSIIKPDAELEATFIISDSERPSNCPNCIRTAPNDQNCLYFIHEERIKVLPSFDKVITSSPDGAKLSLEDKMDQFRGYPYGMALSSCHPQFLYTSVGHCIQAFYTDTCQFAQQWRYESARAGYKSCVMGIQGDELFFRGNDGDTLFSVPVDQDGRLVMSKTKAFIDGVNKLRSACFDEAGHVCVASYKNIEVYSRDGQLLAALDRYPAAGQNPSDIAVLSLNSSSGCELSSQTVIVTTDYMGNAVHFFACSD